MYEETIEKIKEECRIRNHSDLSCKQYVYHVSCFLKWIGDKPLDELTLVDARDTLILLLLIHIHHHHFFVLLCFFTSFSTPLMLFKYSSSTGDSVIS